MHRKLIKNPEGYSDSHHEKTAHWSQPIIILTPSVSGGAGSLDRVGKILSEDYEVIQLYDNRLNKIFLDEDNGVDNSNSLSTNNDLDVANLEIENVRKEADRMVSFSSHPTIQKMVQGFLDEISPCLIENRPVICIGFSFGGIIAREFARLCRSKGKMAYAILLDSPSPAILREQSPADWTTQIFDSINELIKLYLTMYLNISPNIAKTSFISINELPEEDQWKQWALSRKVHFLVRNLKFRYNGIDLNKQLSFERLVRMILLPNIMAANDYTYSPEGDDTIYQYITTHIYAESTFLKYQDNPFFEKEAENYSIIESSTHKDLLSEYTQNLIQILKQNIKKCIQKNTQELSIFWLQRSLEENGSRLDIILTAMIQMCGVEKVRDATEKILREPKISTSIFCSKANSDDHYSPLVEDHVVNETAEGSSAISIVP